MVRRQVGQWTSCSAEPEFAGYVGGRSRERHRVFPCARHRELVQDLQPLADEDRAEVQRCGEAYLQVLERQARDARSIQVQLTFVGRCNARSEEAELHPVELQATGRSGDL
jgi:hypothetical protein